MSSISSDIVTTAQATRSPASDANMMVSFLNTSPRHMPSIDKMVIKIVVSISANFIVLVLKICFVSLTCCC